MRYSYKDSCIFHYTNTHEIKVFPWRWDTHLFTGLKVNQLSKEMDRERLSFFSNNYITSCFVLFLQHILIYGDRRLRLRRKYPELINKDWFKKLIIQNGGFVSSFLLHCTLTRLLMFQSRIIKKGKIWFGIVAICIVVYLYLRTKPPKVGVVEGLVNNLIIIYTNFYICFY